MPTMTRPTLAAALTLLMGALLPPGAVAQAQVRSAATLQRPAAPVHRNPATLVARQALEQRDAAAPRRVRFEWDQVAAAAYLLTGTRAEPSSWALQSVERRVTPASAARWDAHQVAVDVPLGPGAYSWRLVALYPPDDRGDFAHPTTLRFDVR